MTYYIGSDTQFQELLCYLVSNILYVLSWILDYHEIYVQHISVKSRLRKLTSYLSILITHFLNAFSSTLNLQKDIHANPPYIILFLFVFPIKWIPHQSNLCLIIFLLIVYHLTRVCMCVWVCVCCHVLYILCCHFNICNNHYIDWNYVFIYVFWGQPLAAIGCWQSSLTNKGLY